MLDGVSICRVPSLLDGHDEIKLAYRMHAKLLILKFGSQMASCVCASVPGVILSHRCRTYNEVKLRKGLEICEHPATKMMSFVSASISKLTASRLPEANLVKDGTQHVVTPSHLEF